MRQPSNESGVFLADNAGAALCSGPEILRRNPPHSPRSLGAKPSLTLATDDGSGHTGRLDTQNRCGKSKQVRPPTAELSSTQFFVAAPHHRQISALSRDKKLKSLESIHIVKRYLTPNGAAHLPPSRRVVKRRNNNRTCNTWR